MNQTTKWTKKPAATAVEATSVAEKAADQALMTAFKAGASHIYVTSGRMLMQTTGDGTRFAPVPEVPSQLLPTIVAFWKSKGNISPDQGAMLQTGSFAFQTNPGFVPIELLAVPPIDGAPNQLILAFRNKY